MPSQYTHVVWLYDAHFQLAKEDLLTQLIYSCTKYLAIWHNMIINTRYGLHRAKIMGCVDKYGNIGCLLGPCIVHGAMI